MLASKAEREATNIAATARMSDIMDGPRAPVDAGVSLEQQIADGLDRAALVFLEVLESNDKDENGILRIDVKTRAEHFKMLTDWLVKRKKAAPEGNPDTMPPYEKVRKWLDDEGFMIVAKPKAGRPSKEDLRKRAEVLGEAPPPDDAPEPAAPDGELQARLRNLGAR